MESNATNSTESLDNSMQVLRISDKDDFENRKNKDDKSLTTTQLTDKLITTVENLLLKGIKPVPVEEKFKDGFGVIELNYKKNGKKKYHILCFNLDDAVEIYERIHKYYCKETNIEPSNLCSFREICGLSLMQKVRQRFKQHKWSSQGAVLEIVSPPPNFDLESVMNELAEEERLRVKGYIMFLYKLKTNKMYRY